MSSQSGHDSAREQYHFASYRRPGEIPLPPDVYAPPYAEPKSPVTPSMGSGKFLSLDTEEEATRHRRQPRKRIDGADEQHNIFTAIRDNDQDNNWDDIDQVDLHENEEEHGGHFDDELYEQVVEPEDPAVTGAHREFQEDYEDVERQMVREMTYKQRRKALSRIKIEYNISCESSRDLVVVYSYAVARKLSSTERNFF